MRVAVIGGRLQGTEAVYLARKAGWKVRLLDRRKSPPASGLCDDFIRLDALEPDSLERSLKGIDLVVPALEDDMVLGTLCTLARQGSIRLAHHPEAYEVSSSKSASNQLFGQMKLPMPKPWPACGLPAVGKPRVGSGSSGVIRINDEKTALELSADPDNWVVQEYLPGTVYSIEIAGAPGNHRTYQVTELGMDVNHDCKRVIAPTLLPEKYERDLAVSALVCAQKLKLEGLMDVEAVAHGGRMKLLEIDARLPSQTPTAVFHSTGVNLLKAMARAFVPEIEVEIPRTVPLGVVYEHILVSDKTIAVTGEHAMAGAGPLFLRKDFFGADEALAPAHAPVKPFAATMIFLGQNRRQVFEKKQEVMARMQKDLHIEQYLDPVP